MKKLLSIMLVIAMVVCSVPVVFAADLITGLSGAGTESDPVKITSVADWNTFATATASDSNLVAAGVYYQLTADLDFAGSSPVMVSGTFQANLDGNEHVIKNAHIDGANGVYGLLAKTGGNAVITDLGVVDVTLTPPAATVENANSWMGIFSQTSAGGTYKNCFINGIKTTATFNWQKAWGGFSGHSWWATSATGMVFENCYVITKVGETGYITSDSMSGPNAKYFSPFVAWIDDRANSNLTMTNCYTDVDCITAAIISNFTPTVTNTYYNTDNSTGRSRVDVTLGAATTTADMIAESFVSTLGSSFKTGGVETDGYPALSWQEVTPIKAPALIDGLEGEGTTSNPVKIGSEADWELFAAALNADETLQKGDYHFKLTADLDFADYTWAVGAPFHIDWFEGHLDGDYHTISNLSIGGSAYRGLIYQVSGNAMIENLGIIDVTFSNIGDANYGAIAGRSRNINLKNCYVYGVKEGSNVTSDYGALLGVSFWSNGKGVDIDNCYAVTRYGEEGYVGSSSKLNGIVCATSLTNSTQAKISIENSYVDFATLVRTGITGATYTISNSYYIAANTTGKTSTSEGTAKTTAELKGLASTLGSAFKAGGEETSGYPALSWQTVTEIVVPSLIAGLNGDGSATHPVEIGSVADWEKVVAALNADSTLTATGKHYLITADLDFSQLTTRAHINGFNAHLDGGNHVISNMTVGNGVRGLIYEALKGSVIENIGIKDVTFAGCTDVNYGAIAGRSKSSTVKNSFVSGVIDGGSNTALFGGMIGIIFWANQEGCNIENCYVVSKCGETGYVSNSSKLAGIAVADTLTNNTQSKINITNCYTDFNILVKSGATGATYNVTNSYYNSEKLTGVSGTSAGTAKTTAELKALASTLGSAFKASPSAYFNSGYPMLKWESEELPSQPVFNTTIATVDDLKALASATASSYNGLEGVTITLAADLDLGGMEWNNFVIGKESKAFKGIFDGNGHIVSNFKFVENNTASARYGLFGAVGGNGVIKNVGVKDVSSVVAPSLAAGALKYPGSWHAGVVAMALDNAQIQGCFAKNYTINTKDETKTYGIQPSGAGSVIGCVTGAGVVVENCYQYGFIEYNDSVAVGHGLIGGVVEGAATRIENCYSDEAITTCYTADKSKFINCYAVKTTGWSGYGNLPGITKTATDIKGVTPLLGSGFIADVYATNNGYPMLSWELDLTPLEGDGTAANPYLIIDIDTLAQASLHTATEGKYYKMGNNIDFAGATLPSYIGSVENTFKGTFDGDGHIIKNYVIKAPVSGMENYLGIFAAIGGNAVVKNVGIENVTVTNGGEWGYNSRIGGLVAMMYDSATVENCYARGVTFTDSSNGSFAVVYGGGLVGNMYGDGTVVKDCYATGVKETSPIVGSLSGLVGSADKFNYIKNCYSDSTLTMVKVTRMDDVTNSFRAKDDDGSALMRVGELVSAEDLKTKASALGSAFIADSKLINGGFPVLAWEANIEPDKSTNANLASITVSAGELSPEFSADTLSYTVSVENDVTEISISALAQDEKATVSGEVSEVALEVGNNVFNIVVTAEIGNLTKTYTITVVRAAAEGGEGGGTGGGENPEDPEEPTVENEIKSIADLKALAAAVAASDDGLAGKTYTLTTNLDLNGETWTDYIGTSSMYFKGTFDGNGHVISNYKVANTSGTTNALFGAIGGDAIIKNLGVEDVTLIATGTNNIAGLVSNMYDNSKVTSCFARDFVNNQYPASDTNFSIAGLVARMYTEGTVFENCYAVNVGTGNNTVLVNNNGELFGCAVNFTRISNCYANAYLGVVYSAQWSKVTNCYFSSNVASTFYPGWYNPQTSSKDGWASATHAYVGYKVTDAQLKTMADTIGNYFVFDKANVNNRFPVLAWERDFDVVTDKAISGNTLTSVTIEKWNRSAGKVIVATYNSDGMLLNTKFANVSESGVVNVNFDISGADKVVVYILKNDGEATPMSKATKL